MAFYFSFFGLVSTAFAVGLHHWYLFLANIVCVFLLWFYSTSFKRQLIIGNLVISLLTAWTILIFFFAFTSPGNAFTATNVSVQFLSPCFLYAGFAFIISFIREAVKDMEDMEGDARYGCKTLPIVAGIRSAQDLYRYLDDDTNSYACRIAGLYFTIWLVACRCVFNIVFVIAPLGFLLFKTFKSQKATTDFAQLSSYTKWIMLTRHSFHDIFLVFIFRYGKICSCISIAEKKAIIGMGRN